MKSKLKKLEKRINNLESWVRYLLILIIAFIFVFFYTQFEWETYESNEAIILLNDYEYLLKENFKLKACNDDFDYVTNYNGKTYITSKDYENFECTFSIIKERLVVK
jgi:hypothetical protein